MGYVERMMGRNEEIVFVTRQHWLVLIFAALIDLLLAIVIAAIALSVGNIATVLIVLVIFPVGHFVLRFLNWYNEQFIITNRRVMEMSGIINKRVSDSSLEKVNDVVMEQSVLGRILGYGTLEIITGSDIGVDFLEHIKNPVHFKTEMINQKEDLSQLESFGSRARRVLDEEPPTTGDIPELIAELDELCQKGIISQQEFEDKKAELLSRI
jgi:uncharacterized membrane protein YdbT with pleckstrin-like domain